MQPDYIAMLVSAVRQLRPMLPLIILFVALAILAKAFALSAHRQGRNYYRRGGSRFRHGGRFSSDPRHASEVVKIQSAADQLRTVMQADFKATRLLNKSEARLFRAVDKLVVELAPPGWQVMAQVSLGEILQSQDADAFACINSKRVDLLIVDEECRPLHAIEYHGGAHHQGTAAARDAVKKEALRRAGIGYVEVVGGEMSPSELKRTIEKLIKKSAIPV